MSLAFVEDIKNYSGKIFGADIIAGLTVAVILIPQGMAYAMLAGLAPIYGLYAAVVPMIIYPFFSSSRELSIGPVALMSIIIFAGVSVLATPGTAEYLNLVLLTAFLSGIIQVSFSILRLGNLSKYISQPVMTGFIAAAGVIIAISQLKYLFSLQLPRKISIVDMVMDTVLNLSKVNLISMQIGLLGILLIIIFKKIHKAIPGALIIVILGSIFQYQFGLEAKGVPLVGDMPTGIPALSFEFLNLKQIGNLLPTAFIISVVCFIGSFSLAKTFAAQKDNYPIMPNQEFMALGLAKLIGSFFMAMPTTGSFTRSAINTEAGAKTGMSSILSAIFIGLIIAFFGRLFYYLPEPILAAIVITSVFSLINVKEIIHLFKVDRRDFLVLLITFFSTLLLGIVNGIIAGILYSLFVAVVRISRTSFEVLGQLPGTDIYRSVKRFPNAKPVKDALIIRVDQVFMFGNSMNIFDAIIGETLKENELKNLILSFTVYSIPDFSATYKFNQFITYCRNNNLRLILTDVKGPVRDHLHKHGIYEEIGDTNFFLTIADAIHAIEHDAQEKTLSNKYARQTSNKENKSQGLFRF